MKNLAIGYETFTFDILIIGAGGAGLRAAIEASEDKSLKVAVICKSLLGKAHTVMAEGGMAAALGNVEASDSWEVHFRDTIKGGKFLNNYRMAEIHAKEAPQRVKELERFGAVFDRTDDGLIHQRPFGGHSYPRLAHVGDRTGLEMIRTLQDKVIHQGVEVFMEYIVINLFSEEGGVKGALAYNRHNGEFFLFQSKAVILATGGCGRCFQVQTNSWEGTGDGHALGYEAGVEMMDMEFLQFHPTGMVWPLSVAGILVTEGVRGEGGVLKNSRGERFMFDYIPEAFKNDVASTEEEAARWVAGDQKNNRRPPELLTRDVVSRAINAELKAGHGSPHGGVFLDIASQRPPDFIRRKLPSMYHQFMELAEVDITKQPMEVGPTAHYIMGGVRVNPETAESTVNGLFACGEVAAGLHGANRLGGNSLTDLLVFGKRAGAAARERAHEIREQVKVMDEEVKRAIQEVLIPVKSDPDLSGHENPFILQKELKEMMGKYCGIIREEKELETALTFLNEFKARAKKVCVSGGRVFNSGWQAAQELKSLLTVSEMLARAALKRRESRGAHTRADYPEYDQKWARQNIILKKINGEMMLEKRNLPEMPENLGKIIKELG